MEISSTQKPLPLGPSQGAGRLSVTEAVKSSEVVETQPAETAAATQSKKESPSEASREQIEGAVATIQDFVQSVQRSINFALDDSSGRVVVKVTDSGSGDVIRQIPSEEALQMAENLSEVRSLLFKAEA